MMLETDVYMFRYRPILLIDQLLIEHLDRGLSTHKFTTIN